MTETFHYLCLLQPRWFYYFECLCYGEHAIKTSAVIQIVIAAMYCTV